MRNKCIWLVSLLFAVGLFTSAKDGDMRATINKIKKSESYLTAECTLPDKEEAMQLARELLINEINEWVRSRKRGQEVKQIVMQDIGICSEALNIRRGNNTRAFVYIRKKDLIPIYGDGMIVLHEAELSDPNLTSPELVPIPDTGIADHPMDLQSQSADLQSETLRQIIACTDMTGMKEVFATLKGAGRISYGAFTSLSQDTPGVYLLVYDRDGSIKAILDKGSDLRTNLINHKSEKITDYSGMGIYWFRLD